MITPLPENKKKVLYLFCLDNSGSVQVTYKCDDKESSINHHFHNVQDLHTRLGLEKLQ